MKDRKQDSVGDIARVLPCASYAARSLDESVLLKSSSGGVIAELSKAVLRDGGLVIGAKWTSDYSKVEHAAISSEKDLSELQGSKYLVSDIHKIYVDVAQALSSGQRVLFVGTPCQTAAIRKKFGVNEHLVVCAIACMGNIPSYIWCKYIHSIEKTVGSKVSSVNFRDKRLGWKRSCFSVSFESAHSIYEPLYDNEYMKVFLSGWANMQSCLACQFRAGKSGADLLVGDFWGVEDVFHDMDVHKGVNVVLVYNPCLINLLKQLKLDIREVAYEQAIAKNPFIEKSPQVNWRQRKRFQRYIHKESFSSAVRLAAKKNMLDHVIDCAVRGVRKMRRLVWG